MMTFLKGADHLNFEHFFSSVSNKNYMQNVALAVFSQCI